MPRGADERVLASAQISLKNKNRTRAAIRLDHRCAALGGIASAAFAVVFLWIPERRAARLLPHFVSFATGALLGAALLGAAAGGDRGRGCCRRARARITLVAGLWVFFVIEKLVLWWQRTPTRPLPKPLRAAPAPPTITRTASVPRVCWYWSATASTTPSMGCSSRPPFSQTSRSASSRPSRSPRTRFRTGSGTSRILVHAGFSRERALVLNLATGLASVVGAVAAFLRSARATGGAALCPGLRRCGLSLHRRGRAHPRAAPPLGSAQQCDPGDPDRPRCRDDRLSGSTESSVAAESPETGWICDLVRESCNARSGTI